MDARTALDAVIDPELDEPITDLGFVTEAVVVEGVAAVRLRLPTYFCAANFAYLMVADAHDAVGRAPGLRSGLLDAAETLPFVAKRAGWYMTRVPAALLSDQPLPSP